MAEKPVNPKLKQIQTTKDFGCSCSTLQRYRNDLNMLSTFRIPSKCHKKRKDFKS